MCPDPPPRRSPSRWSEGTVRRSCLGGDSLAQGCTAVEPSREGCWRCPVPLRRVSSGVVHLACVREPGTSWAHRCSGCWLPDRRRRCPRADPCQGRGRRHPSLSRGQASTIQASWSCGTQAPCVRRVAGGPALGGRSLLLAGSPLCGAVSYRPPLVMVRETVRDRRHSYFRRRL